MLMSVAQIVNSGVRPIVDEFKIQISMHCKLDLNSQR